MYQPNNNQWFYEQEKERLAVEQYINNSNRLQNDRYLQCTRINQNIQINMRNPFTIMPRQSARLNYQFPIQQPVQNNYTSFYQQPEIEHKFKTQQQIQHDKNEYLKIMYDHAKQTIENLITKPFLSYDEQKMFDDCRDFVDMIDSRETIQDHSKPFIVKLDSVYKIARIMNKHCPICIKIH